MAQVVNPELQGLNVNVFRQSDIEESVANQMDAAIARQEAQQAKRRLQQDVSEQKQVNALNKLGLSVRCASPCLLHCANGWGR